MGSNNIDREIKEGLENLNESTKSVRKSQYLVFIGLLILAIAFFIKG